MKCSLAGFIVTMLFFSFTLSAQDNGGVVMGKVKDSSYNVVLGSATVAVYKKADSTLLQFCIPNSFGEFSLSNLPFNDTLRIQLTHVGYDKYENTFIIRADKKLVDLGWIYLNQYATVGDEVIVKAAIDPVRMNGDTLEFNPRAFKMKTDATAEDLMRRLPGFTIWSDGTITFNGKEIKSLFVDGKPFLGGKDITIATQNLPKDALDKIQVYQQYDEQNPLDSTLMANLKMKYAKKMGYFGKLGLGAGTDNRYVADGMLSGFNKKLQVSAVVTANNTNKIAKDIDVLIRNNSFKGEGNNIDYQPDFNLAGLNKPVTGGLRFQYDFISDVENQRNEAINADYFINHNNTQINKSATTRTILTPDSFLVRRTSNSNSIAVTHQHFKNVYRKTDRDRSFSISFDGGSDYKRTVNIGTDEQERTGLGVVSNGNVNAESRELSKNGLLTAEFIKHNDWYNSPTLRHKRIPTDFTLRYSFNIISAEGSGRNQSSFTNFSIAGQPTVQAFDRLYSRRDSVSKSSAVYAQYPYLRQLIFGEKRFGNIDLKLGGNLVFHHNDYDNVIADVDTFSKNYLPNNYLTNKRQQHITDLQPELIVSKQFKKNLTNRYSQYIILEAIARSQYYTSRHNATQAFQNFHYHYGRFIPQVSATYNNHRFGKREVKVGVKYQTQVSYPTIQQIAPLVDSTNLWLIPRGNSHIRPEYHNNYSAFYLFESRQSKNPYSIGLNFDYTRAKDKMTDSSLYDDAGRMQVYTTNTNGYRYWHASTLVKKAFSPNKYNTFEFSAQYNLNRYVVPQYIDHVNNISKSMAHNIDGQLGYTYRHIVNLKIQQGINYYHQEQYGSNSAGFTSNVYYTRIGGTVLFFNQLLCSSNITYRISAAQSQAAIKYKIWNASVAYRFLKGNQGEIKFSALDLLKQNMGVINVSERNTQTFGYNNVMQQYFLLSFAWYPRKFDK
jgi:hypothetical protein